MHELDRPIWGALTTGHRAFARGSALALRFDPAVSPFAACRDDGPEALAQLAALVPETGMLVLLQAGEAPVPPGCAVGLAARGVQLRLDRLRPQTPAPAAVELGEGDVPEMLALTGLTKPGPFLPGTRRLGRFVGVRRDGRLAAMAGERLRPGGWTEISAVCTHPDFRGLGLAAQLSALVVEGILARGERPFLHAFADNEPAIRLYQRLGFVRRCEMSVLGLQRPTTS